MSLSQLLSNCDNFAAGKSLAWKFKYQTDELERGRMQKMSYRNLLSVQSWLILWDSSHPQLLEFSNVLLHNKCRTFLLFLLHNLLKNLILNAVVFSLQQYIKEITIIGGCINIKFILVARWNPICEGFLFFFSQWRNNMLMLNVGNKLWHTYLILRMTWFVKSAFCCLKWWWLFDNKLMPFALSRLLSDDLELYRPGSNASQYKSISATLWYLPASCKH